MQVRCDHILATLFGRLITLAQRILINFLTQQLFIPMSLIILIIACPSLLVVSFTSLHSFGFDSTHMSAGTTLL